MITLFKFGKKNDSVITEDAVRDQILRRAIINQEKRKQKITVETSINNNHTDTLKKIEEILDKVSGYENSKITAVTELLLALESGDDKNLIKFLKTKDKVVKLKSKY